MLTAQHLRLGLLTFATVFGVAYSVLGIDSTSIQAEPQARMESFALASPHGIPSAETFERDPTVRVVVTTDSGAALDPDGAVAGSYRFYPLGQDRPIRGHLLKITIRTPNGNTHGHFFLCDDARTTFRFVGHSDYQAELDVDPTTPFCVALHRLAFEPGSFDRNDLTTLSTRSYFPPSGQFSGAFYNTYVPFLVKTVASALAGEPAPLAFTEATAHEDANVFLTLLLDSTGRISMRQRESIALHFEQVWADLEFGPKLALLKFLGTGNLATDEIRDRLIIEWLGQLNAANLDATDPRDQRRRALFDFLSGFLDHNSHFLSPRSPSRQRIAAELATYLRLPGPLFNASTRGQLLLPALTAGHGLNYDLTPDLDAFRDLVRRQLESFAATPGTLLLIAADFLAAGGAARLTTNEIALIDEATKTGTSDWITYYAYRAIQLNVPELAETSRLSLLRFLERQDFNGLDLPVWGMMDYVRADELNRLPADLQARILRGFGSTLRNEASKRAEGADVWYGDFDSRFSHFVRLIRGSPAFADYAGEVSAVLPFLNPRQPGEPESAYGDRLQRVTRLWLEQRIALYDLRGGTFERPAYLDVLSSYGRHCPDWLHVCVLATSEGGEAKAGVAQFNWRDVYTDGALLGVSVVHEGAHSLHLRHEPRYLAVDVMIRHWYAEADWSDPDAYVSDYARTNEFEFWAEYARYWHLDSRPWLRRAVESYRRGSPVMLNMFLFLASLSRPENAPPGDFFPLFTLGPAGLLTAEYLPVHWRRGDVRDGELEFRFEDKDYRIQYRRFLIAGVEESGIRIGAPPLPLELTLPDLVEGAEFERLTLRPSVLGYDVVEGGVLFSLVDSPTGLTLDPRLGTLDWIPGELDGGTTNVVEIKATDLQRPELTGTHRMLVAVREVNTPPEFVGQADPTIPPLTLLSVTNRAVDADLPANRLSYRLLEAPPGARIDNAGVITWTPPLALSGSTQNFTTVVTDDGIPAASATNRFVVVVEAPPVVSLSAPQWRNGELAFEVRGPQRWNYVLQSATDPTQWTDVLTYPSAPTPFVIAIRPPGAASHRFYRLFSRP